MANVTADPAHPVSSSYHFYILTVFVILCKSHIEEHKCHCLKILIEKHSAVQITTDHNKVAIVTFPFYFWNIPLWACFTTYALLSYSHFLSFLGMFYVHSFTFTWPPVGLKRYRDILVILFFLYYLSCFLICTKSQLRQQTFCTYLAEYLEYAVLLLSCKEGGIEKIVNCWESIVMYL